MPLSEQEQRLLDEMERHLIHNDADVVSAPRDGRTLNYRNIVVRHDPRARSGSAASSSASSTSCIVVGVIGFVVMFGGVHARGHPDPRHPAQLRADAAAGAAASRERLVFMDRMNERWDRRQEGPLTRRPADRTLSTDLRVGAFSLCPSTAHARTVRVGAIGDADSRRE